MAASNQSSLPGGTLNACRCFVAVPGRIPGHPGRHPPEAVGFADALHLASAGESAEFVTFDRKFVSRAGEIQEGVPVRFQVIMAK